MDNVTSLPTPESNGAGEPKKRGQSTIKFPYSDLPEAERLTREVFVRGGVCQTEQLAAWLGHGTVNSGAFRNKVSAARIFGLIETTRNQITITEDGKQIADDQTAPAARVKAFLTVPLYRAMYDEHKSGQLPPDSGLERVMIRLGVTPTQAQGARQVFQRSAEHAGFFAVGRNRLVLPAGSSAPVSTGPSGDEPDHSGRGKHEDPPPPPPPPSDRKTYPKVIEGILEEAPWRQGWDEDQFREWADLLVRAARVHFKLPDPERKTG